MVFRLEAQQRHEKMHLCAKMRFAVVAGLFTFCFGMKASDKVGVWSDQIVFIAFRPHTTLPSKLKPLESG